jgi:hypothetical protein
MQNFKASTEADLDRYLATGREVKAARKEAQAVKAEKYTKKVLKKAKAKSGDKL